MSLVADYSSNSSSSSEDEDETNEINETRSKYDGSTSKLPLPSANILLSSDKPGKVFSNPYKEAENAKIASLERHVKMVDSEHIKEKNGKKICWNYRKGRCRFGSNCTFAHDSDLQITQERIDDGNQIPIKTDIPLKATMSKPQFGLQIGAASTLINNNFSVNNTTNNNGGNSSTNVNLNDNRNYNNNTVNNNNNNTKKIKRHLGLNDSIVPSKKVIKQYNTFKNTFK